MQNIRIYIADDHQIIIDGLVLLLGSESNIQIVGSANDGLKAYEDIIKLKPDIAILDLKMPGKEGLEIIKQLFQKTTTKFIVLTMQIENRLLQDAKNYNAYGFLLKNTGKAELLDTIYKVSENIKVFKAIKKEDNKPTFLSYREIEVLKLIHVGLSTAEISEKLNLSPYTVSTHRKNILRKTDQPNFNALIKWAIDKDILN